MKYNKQHILSILKDINVIDVINIYIYGSRVYGNCNENSDYDYTIITRKEYNLGEIIIDDINIHIITLTELENLLFINDIKTFEEVYHSKQYPILINKEYDIFEYLDRGKLRVMISSIVSNSFVKAKKKIIKENELYKGQKSLFNSLRI